MAELTPDELSIMRSALAEEFENVASLERLKAAHVRKKALAELRQSIAIEAMKALLSRACNHEPEENADDAVRNADALMKRLLTDLPADS